VFPQKVTPTKISESALFSVDDEFRKIGCKMKSKAPNIIANAIIDKLSF